MPRGDIEHKTWLSITEGKVREKVEEGTPGAVYRKSEMNGETYENYEIVNDFVEGYITDIKITESEYGRRLEIMMNDGDEQFVIRVKWNSQYTGSFLQRAPHIDFSLPVKIFPYYIKKDKKPGISVFQGGEKLESFYTREDRNGMPVFPESGGEDDLAQWKLDMGKFFHQELVNRILPALNATELPGLLEKPEEEEFNLFAEDLPEEDEGLKEPPAELTKEKRQENREAAQAKLDGDPGPEEGMDNLQF